MYIGCKILEEYSKFTKDIHLCRFGLSAGATSRAMKNSVRSHISFGVCQIVIFRFFAQNVVVEKFYGLIFYVSLPISRSVVLIHVHVAQGGFWFEVISMQ